VQLVSILAPLSGIKFDWMILYQNIWSPLFDNIGILGEKHVYFIYNKSITMVSGGFLYNIFVSNHASYSNPL
jgi:hypothetical protein